MQRFVDLIRNKSLKGVDWILVSEHTIIILEVIVEANRARKDHIADMILKQQPKTVAIYRLTMKTDLDNFRASLIQGIMKRLKGHGIDVVYEPVLKEETFYNSKVIRHLEGFKAMSDVIVSNYLSKELEDVEDKV